ncbi:PH domain-containing protein [Actinoplanes sp. NPDC049802]|uniref:PH domain-containing protein n=1 Tax=Actinoplanes sp. NPDC049802 TaxID=3154742 RepID=UPI0033C58D96
MSSKPIMHRWVEPYESPIDSGLRYWGAGVVALLALAMWCGGAGEGARPDIGWLPPAAALAVCAALIWRMTHIGVAVSDYGVRVRNVPRTHTVPWSAVERAWVGPATRCPTARVMWIAVRGARDVETLLWLRGTNDRRGTHEGVLLDAADVAYVVDLINRRAVVAG